MLTVIFAVTGVVMRAIGRLGASDLARRHRTRVDKPNPRITRSAHMRSVVANTITSTALVVGVTLAFRSRLFTSHPVGALRTVGEAVAILAVYDLGYYVLHRWALHGWSVGRRIHAVHHAIRTPYVNDSLYLHPAETLAGVGLFLASTAIVGPVGLWSFGAAFFVYSVLNLWNHSGIDLPRFPLRTLSRLVRHHDVHHESMQSGYYATVTPLWDIVFGTARPG
jgi:sterol desaturase/sphingolipid hydroxylase (fatty acid hydroxylase superfamily)